MVFHLYMPEFCPGMPFPTSACQIPPSPEPQEAHLDTTACILPYLLTLEASWPCPQAILCFGYLRVCSVACGGL